MKQITQEEGAKILQNYSKWLSENMNDLIAHYSGKVVAIQEGAVVAVGDSYQEVYALFEKSNQDWMPLVIEVPDPDKAQGLLI